MLAMRAAARVARTTIRARTPPALRRRTITTTAAVCTELGAPLTVRDDWTLAEPGPGEVLVQTRAAGLNRPRCSRRRACTRCRLEPPFVPGNECSGTVEAVGAGVAHVNAGDAVIALPRGGAWARHCVVSGAAVAPLPKPPSTDAEWRQAASLAVAYGTADMALRRRAYEPAKADRIDNGGGGRRGVSCGGTSGARGLQRHRGDGLARKGGNCAGGGRRRGVLRRRPARLPRARQGAAPGGTTWPWIWFGCGANMTAVVDSLIGGRAPFGSDRPVDGL